MFSLAFLSCAGPRLLGDGTSISVGTHARGTIRHPARLAHRGDGYVVPAEWRSRQSNYGTDEVIELIVRSARRVAQQYRGSMLGVADLSRRRGGESSQHKSHQNGRDVDLIPYSVGPRGNPMTPPASRMQRYGADGRAIVPVATQQTTPGQEDRNSRRFDDMRNWALVRALITDAMVDVQWIFVSAELEDRLLRYAGAHSESPWVIEHARLVMHQPGDAQRHDDHMHVRVYCAADDRALGCSDRGPERWLKKELKPRLLSRTTRKPLEDISVLAGLLVRPRLGGSL